MKKLQALNLIDQTRNYLTGFSFNATTREVGEDSKKEEKTHTSRMVDLFAHTHKQIPDCAALHPYVAINSLMARAFR